MPSSSRPRVATIPAKTLFVSEPHPIYFGNDANETGNKHWSATNWLQSRFHFSFAEYSNPRRANFGVLRVLNDDLVQPMRGFGTHPHRDMEICTYVVHGELTHQDSMGTAETLGRGAVQFMSAGTGVRHSEYNHSATAPLRFIQMWIVPRETGWPPAYGGASVPPAIRRNRFCHLVSDAMAHDVDTPVKINQDANIFVAELDKGKAAPFVLHPGRMAYVLCVEGDGVKLNDVHTLQQHDAAQLQGPMDVTFAAKASPAHILIVEMQQA